MRFFYKTALGLIILSSFIITFNFLFKSSLLEDQALRMVYGNYDYSSKSAIWMNISFSDNDTSSYFKERQGVVKAIFFQPYYENGKRKVFLLTKTIPTNIHFDCHACLPLIGAAIFVRKMGHWKLVCPWSLNTLQ